MSTIYFIYTFSKFGTLFCVVAVIWFFLAAIVWISNHMDGKKSKPKMLIYPILLLLASMLIPNEEEMLIIYGVGGTIDYLKSNPTATHIPDKCIKALDMYLDKCMGDSTTIKNK